MCHAPRDPHARGFGERKFFCLFSLAEPKFDFASQIQSVVRIRSDKKKEFIEIVRVPPAIKPSRSAVFEYRRFQGRNSYAGTRRMNVRYYLVAVLFILFDVEIIFFYPWAVNFRALVSTCSSSAPRLSSKHSMDSYSPGGAYSGIGPTCSGPWLSSDGLDRRPGRAVGN